MSSDSYARLFSQYKVDAGLTKIGPVVCNNMQITPRYARDCANGWLFIVASFPPNDEPQVWGGGILKEQALAFARYCSTFAGAKPIPDDAVICMRISHNVWRGPQGQIVTLDDCKPKRSMS